MSTTSWRRPLLMAVASLTLVSGTACAAQAATHTATATATGYSALAGRSADCGKGGEGGKGGAGGTGGSPGRPGEPGRPGGCLSLKDLPDKAGPDLTAMDKVRIVLTVTSGHATKADIAKKYKISEKEVDIWQRQFQDGDWLGLLDDSSTPGS
ncbi:DUF1153 domain-containing protein [Streptomyces sp. WI03-4A]|uniref:DUF1153 domain-containing protein n=1 Tax=Streptomyces sp. WI03-4A TaxID=3028706 RepID=UPI0029A95C2B|nr:DUF1153 domain-containing protein [Streptomyces sp. WI03-4A]MDX2592989.1 DUF1153 domain-containing protein [Streptomyces sp. WI03-4A]